MAKYTYMQNLNEISQVVFKLNIILLYMGVYGHLKIGHTLNTSYNDMLNLN